MPELDPKVPGEPTGSVAPQSVTPAGEGVVAPTVTTPVQSPKDAEAALREKYEKDIAKIKSTFQSQDAQRQKEWNQRQQQYERELEKLRVSQMNEEQRKAYEQEKVSTTQDELRRRLEELEEESETMKAMFTAQQWFLEKGVPANVLVTTEGYEAMWNSGINWITSEFERLRTQPAKTVIPPTVPPTAPSVDTGTGVPPAPPSWEELEKKYGSREKVYQLIEERRLSPSILPK